MKAVTIHILEERCKGCGVCVEVCQTSVLAMSGKANIHGYNYPVAENPTQCLLCGMCEMFCPDFAIWADIEKDEARE